MDWVSRFWSHTVVQICAWLISIGLGAYLGYLAAGWSEKTRELSYTVSPASTSIVKAGAVSALSVSYKGAPVTTDVSAVQVQIWNQGRDSIRGGLIPRGHMLKPLVITTTDQTPILEAVVRDQTRPDIVNLDLDDSAQQSGRINVSWDILEEGDAGIIQLIIAGKPDVKISAAAAIEGQKNIREIVSPRGPTVNWLLLVIMGLSVGVFFIGLPMYLLIMVPRWVKQIAALLGPFAQPQVLGALLHYMSTIPLPRSWRIGWYIANIVIILIGLFASGIVLWTMQRSASTPTPPLVWG